MKNKFLILLSVLFFGGTLIGCTSEEGLLEDFAVTGEGFTLDGDILTVSGEQQNLILNVTSSDNNAKWTAISPTNDIWFTFHQEGGQLFVNFMENDENDARESFVLFAIGDTRKRITVIQEYVRHFGFDFDEYRVGSPAETYEIPFNCNFDARNIQVEIDGIPSTDPNPWIYDLSISNVSEQLAFIKFSVLGNADAAINNATLNLSVRNESVTASLPIIQSAIYGKSYIIDASDVYADFSNDYPEAYIYEIYDNSDPESPIKIGEICKEFLFKAKMNSARTKVIEEIVNGSYIVAYATDESGDVNYLNGYVTNNGGTVSWNQGTIIPRIPNGRRVQVKAGTAPDKILSGYTPGNVAQSNTLYIARGSNCVKATPSPEDDGIVKVQATLLPLIHKETRSGVADNQGGRSETWTHRIVKVGTQYWFAENLKFSRWKDGDPIPTGMSSTEFRTQKAKPGCAVALRWGPTLLGYYYSDANADGTLLRRDQGGCLYNYWCIWKYYGFEDWDYTKEWPGPEALGLTDQLAPQGWKVASIGDFQIMIDYCTQTTQDRDISTIPEMWKYGSDSRQNISGFSGVSGYYRNMFTGYFVSTYYVYRTSDYFYRSDYTYINSALKPGVTESEVNQGRHQSWMVYVYNQLPNTASSLPTGYCAPMRAVKINN